MANSQRPRLRELRAIYLLVGECIEMGSDPLVWRRHMLERLREIFGAAMSFGGEAIPPPRPDEQWRQWMVDVGWTDETSRELYQQWMRQHLPEDNPFTVGMFAQRGRLPVRYRRQIVDDDTWYGSEFFQLLRHIKFDDMLGSYFVDGQGHLHITGIVRASDARPFGERERRLLWLSQRELIPRMGGALATFERPTVADLSPRLRQTLLCLLQGKSEKQAAERLGIAHNTLHEHAKLLHRHFDVSSRGELLSQCVGLYPVLMKLEYGWDGHFTTVENQ